MRVLEVLAKLRSASKGDKASEKVVESLISAVESLREKVDIDQDLDEETAWHRVEADLKYFTYENLLKARQEQGLSMGPEIEKDLVAFAEAASQLAQMLHSIRNPV